MAESDSRPYGLVYLVTNLKTGKVYVGQTTTTVQNRWKGHCNSGHKSRLWLSIQAHGRHSFTIEKIAEAKTKAELDELEREFIAKHNATDSRFGYNFERGGSGAPRSKESAQSTAEKLRGRKLSEEQKQKIAASKKGKKLTAEHIAKVKAAKAGYRHSDEARRRMSEVKMGKTMPPVSAECRRKLSEASKASWAKRKQLQQSESHSA